MNRSAIKLLVLIITSVIFYSCTSDDSLVEYTNKYDPKSPNYIPGVPGDLWIRFVTDSYIQLGWRDQSLGESGFTIERSDSTENHFAVVGACGVNTEIYSDYFDIKPGINYYYRIRSYKNNSSVYSNIVSAKVELKAPSDLRLNLYGKKGIQLLWTNNTYFADSNVIQCRIPAESSEFKTIGKTYKIASYYLPDLDTNKTYEFRVYSETSRNVTLPSDPIAIYYGAVLENAWIPSYSSGANFVDFSPVNNDFVASAGDLYNTRVMVYDADYNTVRFTLQGYYGGYAKYNPQGNQIAIGASSVANYVVDNKVTFVDPSKASVIDDIRITARSLDYSPDRRKLAIGSYKTTDAYEDQVGVVDLGTYKPLWLKSGTAGKYVKMTPDGSRLIAVQPDQSNDKIVIYNASNGSVIKVIEPGSSAITDLQVSDDGSMFAFSSNSSPSGSSPAVQIWSLNSYTKIRQINVFSKVLAFSHDSKLLAVCPDYIKVYRVSDGEDLGPVGSKIHSGFDVSSLSFNYKDNMIAAGRMSSSPVVVKIKMNWKTK